MQALRFYPTTQRTAIVKLMEILIDLVNSWTNTGDPPFSPFFDRNDQALQEVRSVGKTLNEIGGFKLMSTVCNAIPEYHRRELDFAWNDIGNWRA